MKISNSVGTGFPESKFYIFEEHRSRGFQHGMSLSPPIFFPFNSTLGTCDQLKSGHMPLVCILRFFYFAQWECNKKENAQFSLLLSCRSTAMVCLSGSPSSCSFCYSVLGPFSFVRRKQRCLEFTCSELVSALSSLSSFSPFGSFTVSESLTKLDEEFSTKIWYSTPIPCWIPCYLYTTSLLSLWKSSIYHLSKYTISSILKIV